MQDLKRKNQKRLTTTTILKPGLSPKFFLNLLKEISPIVAIDDTQTILFANESFQKEFAGSSRSLIGKNLFRILNLNPVDHEEMKSNINLSKWGKIQNQEFRKQKIYYGYSVFRFGDHIGIILKNITENKRLERKIASLHTQLLQSQEEERIRLSGELHDGVGQTILAAKLNFQAYNRNPKVYGAQFDTGLLLIDKASQELRDIYTNLHPSTLREIGLEAAIRSLSSDLFPPMDVEADLDLNLKLNLEPMVANQVFRIVQEIFQNVIKHSQASKISLKVQVKGRQLFIDAKDNGIGFQERKVRARSSGFGLENIRRRVEDLNGKIKIDSSAGKGTKFIIRIPLEKNKNTYAKKT
ncbi:MULTISPECIES: sensor histidine kinase [Leptospira]|uniref:Oxygen sensor histidine kinase NreB n=4 Tax=Leptospira kirschneri TaxID=29507 RepID=A0A1T1DQV4_9LEPT|nr:MULTISPECIES: ATP-binding protein [Leptospira]EJO69568.1 GHKL domain protein [Leptospira kirschneri serovar Grippotyphosa str. RM52]EKO16211.1 GHKL domain protein [Leptospira kirschneri str. H1]EKO52221.1 GHKL domain protein [Leptospira kirschneri str. 200802841]EKO62148.1 GHKL domain protein [Leptospira kirschneri str. H2]EKP06471.1 GHKL domain protein [Leptospira kirschneri str. 2008720114]